jgi:serine/threonine-protein kinase
MMLSSSGLARESVEFGLSESPPELPLSFGRYAVESTMAHGGMGVVYRCYDPEYERTIAMKALLPKHAGKPEFLRRFQREIQITSHLEHPGIVPVYEKGVLDDGRPYFTMRVVHGESLDKILHTAERPRLLRIFGRICQAIAYAHAQGVIHRDLKPENILVGQYGIMKVIDWGVAKILPGSPLAHLRDAETESSAEFSLPDDDSLSNGTLDGFVLGTPAYLSPEQASGEVQRVDARTDVFGLGAILCAMLTGKPPYSGENGKENLSKARKANLADATVRLQRCGAESALTALTLRCLAPNPDDRPANAEILAAEFTAYLESDLRRAERDLVRFFELSLDMFCIAGIDGYFKRVNPNFSKVLGYEAADLLSVPFMEFVHPDDRETTAAVMGQLLGKTKVSGFRNRYRDADHRYHYVEWNAQAATDDGLIFAAARHLGLAD